MKNYQLNAYKFMLQSTHHRFFITIPYNYSVNKVNELPYRHIHAKYEVVFVHYEDNAQVDKFIIIPPLVEHNAYNEERYKKVHATTFQFAIEEKKVTDVENTEKYKNILESFLYMKQTITINDTFSGVRIMQSIWDELQEKSTAYFEAINTELLLLMIELARRLPLVPPNLLGPPERNIDEIRLDLIEYFFFDNHNRPDCKRADLSRLLRISERQLSRMMEIHYGMSFRDRLLKTRMEIAEARRKVSPVSADELAEMVGYTSTPAFLAAYKSYYGFSYKVTKEQ